MRCQTCGRWMLKCCGIKHIAVGHLVRESEERFGAYHHGTLRTYMFMYVVAGQMLSTFSYRSAK